MSAEEELCRWAFAKAMRIPSVCKALNDAGRAIYHDDNALGRPSPFHRFVLSRVDLQVDGRAMRSIVYCNGIAVS